MSKGAAESHIAELPEDESEVTPQDGSPIPYPDLPGSSGGSSPVSVPEPPGGGWQPTPGDNPGALKDVLGTTGQSSWTMYSKDVKFEGNFIRNPSMTDHSGSGPLPDTNTQTSRLDGDQEDGGDPEGDSGSTSGGGSTGPTPSTQSFEPVDEPVEFDPALDEPFESDRGPEIETGVEEVPLFDEADSFDIDLG
jgi:hypothetical protein